MKYFPPVTFTNERGSGGQIVKGGGVVKGFEVINLVSGSAVPCRAISKKFHDII
jgi:hypothetical protein